MEKVIAVIPVKGRLPLLRRTIERLYNKNGVFKVICIGGFEEKEVCEAAGAEFIIHENNPLGKKWNAGFLAARNHKPDAVLFVGSSDWVSDNWLPTIMPFIKQGVDLIGKPDFYLLDIGKEKRFCHWKGYEGQRRDEPIGIGRVISKKMLDLMNWRPIKDDLNNSIDFSMYQNVLKLRGKVMMLRGYEIQSLSISCDRWPNMHRFEDHYSNKLPSVKYAGYDEWLNEKFPEHKIIFR